jgi:hypothetical protein
VRRRSHGRKTFKEPNQGTLKQGTLSDRAVTTGLLYNYLEYVSPADVDGIKRAYVNVKDNSIDAELIPANKGMVAQMYGMKPTIIADMKAPTALISRYSPKDSQFPELERFGTTMLRKALRKIVDEV